MSSLRRPGRAEPARAASTAALPVGEGAHQRVVGCGGTRRACPGSAACRPRAGRRGRRSTSAPSMSWVTTIEVTPVRSGDVADQPVHGRGVDGVEAGDRLVVEQDLRLARRWRGPGPRACACRPTAPRAAWSSTMSGSRFTSSSEPRHAAQRPPAGPCVLSAAFGQARRPRSRTRSWSRRGPRSGTRSRPCGGSPAAPRRPRANTDCPSMRTSPASGTMRPMVVFRRTLLPVPEGPTTARVSPVSTVKLTPASTGTSNALWTSRYSIMPSSGKRREDGVRAPARR